MADVWRTLVFVFVAFVAWAASGVAMFVIPTSPHYEALRSIKTIDVLGGQPSSAQAEEAFDEFLRIGQQVRLVESTVSPAIAAVAVTLLALKWSAPSRLEFGVLVLAFAVWQAARSGVSNVDWLDCLGISVFATTLWMGRWLAMYRRGRLTNANL